MIKRLRRRFVLTNMLLVSVVLLAVFCAVGASTVHQLSTENDIALRAELMHAAGGDAQKLFIGPARERPKEQREALLPTFSVTLDAEGNILRLNAQAVEISFEDAASAVAQALAAGGSEGSTSSPALRFLREGSNIAFVSREHEISAVWRFLLTSALVGVSSLAAFFLISLFLSRLALRPVERAWAQQRRFVADASHELKTPLTVMLANVSILSSHPEETVASQRRWVDSTRQEAERMKKLVDDLLFLARADDRRMPAAREPVCLSDVLWGCILSFEPVAFEQGISLDSQIDPDLYVQGDAGQLKQLCAILLDNACKYAGPSGRVHARLSARQGRAALCVRNTGEPIPAEKLPHIFERFYRADAARARGQGGYGLGLSIAQNIVQAHGGRITAESSREEGTLFTVALPLCAPPSAGTKAPRGRLPA